MNRGIAQNLNTCWFYSSLNIFLLSDNGLKIFWKKLQDVYGSLTANQKAYFNSNVNTPCPTGINKVNLLYFWKFFDEYMCALGGPGRLHTQARKSRNLLKNMNFSSAALKEAKGLAPGKAQAEIKPILRHIGFTDAEVRYVSHNQAPNASWTQPIVIRMHDPTTPTKYLWARSAPNWRPAGYELTGVSIYIDTQYLRIPHQIAGVIQGGKKLVFDSARPYDIWEVDWTDEDEFWKFITSKYGKVKWVLWSFLVYTRKDFTNKISPSCRRIYRPISQANMEFAMERFGSAPYIFSNIMRGRTRAGAGGRIPPRMMAHILQEWGKRPLLTKNTFQSLLNSATSWNHGLKQLKQLEEAGYRYNYNGNNFLNFKTNLLKKFPRAIPPYMRTSILRQIESGNLKTKNAAMNKYEKYARNANLTVNKNSRNWKNFEVAVNRALSTRRRKSVKANSPSKNKK
jgi:hypothetical protein